MAKDRGYLGTALERNRRWPAPDVGLGEPLTLLLGNKLLDFDAREDSWDSRDGKIPGGVGDTTPNTITTRQSSPHASGVADTHPLYRIGPLREPRPPWQPSWEPSWDPRRRRGDHTILKSLA